MKTEAQKRAENAYRKKTKTIAMRFYPNNSEDAAIYEWIKSQENATEYLKSLVQADMEGRVSW